MRQDLNKLLCERERVRSKSKYRGVRHKKEFTFTADEDGGDSNHESMKERYTRGTGIWRKEFNENLNPLYGAIRKAVGRPWDAFYKDLCQVFDKRKVVNQHILEHLKDFVVTDTFLNEDGEVMIRRRWQYRDPSPLRGSTCEFYVHPTTKLLLENKHRLSEAKAKRAYKEKIDKVKKQEFRQIDEYNILQKIDNVWYHFELKDNPDRKIIGYKENIDGYGKYAIYNVPYPKDVFPVYKTQLKGNLSFRQIQNLGMEKSPYHQNPYVSPKKYHFAKKTASHKLLKKHGVIQ